MSGCPASLSSGAQTPCTVPVHTSKVITLPMEWVITLLWNGRSLSNGIGDHFALESACSTRFKTAVLRGAPMEYRSGASDSLAPPAPLTR